MNDFLKIKRNGQILEIVLDRPKANALDAPSCRLTGTRRLLASPSWRASLRQVKEPHLPRRYAPARTWAPGLDPMGAWAPAPTLDVLTGGQQVKPLGTQENP